MTTTTAPTDNGTSYHYFHGLCRDPMLNRSLSWDTENPNLSQCMRDFVLSLGPALLIVITAPPWLYRCYLRDQSSVSRRFGWLFWSKVLLCLLLAANALVDLGDRSHRFGAGLATSDVVGPCSLLAAYIVSCAMVILEKRWRNHTSVPQWFFWFFLTICGAPTFKVHVEELMVEVSFVAVLLTVTFWPLVCLQLLLHSVSDLDEKRDFLEPSEHSASAFSLLFFSWLDPLMWMGFKTPLKDDMLPRAPAWVNVTSSVYRLMAKWNDTVISKGVDFTKDKTQRVRVSLIPVLARVHGGRFLYCSLLGLLHYTLSIVNPQFLKLLVNHIREGEEAWKGFLYAAMMLATSMVWTVSFHQMIQNQQIIAIQMRSSIVSLIYRKALRLSNKARRSYTVGEITNHMSVDAQRITESFWQCTNLWTSPYVIILCLYFIYLELGPPVLAGIAVMSLLIPLNIIATKIGERLEKTQLANKDSRLKVMSELLNGIKVLKLYAWELPFMRRVMGIREKEITMLKKSARVWATINFTYSCTPMLTALAVFTTYVLTDPENHVLTADKVFVTIAYFNVIKLPTVFFPWALMECIKLYVSLTRICNFLNSEELDPAIVAQEVKGEQNAIEIENATFSWFDEPNSGEAESSAPFVLDNIDLKIPHGSLTAIVGVVGAGKSSLLSAILGNMNKRSGFIGRVGSVAYVPQQAWIQNLSLKDNILFDKKFNSTKYNEVIDSCALKADLDILTAGDSTEIGENGINLSGGQKQRVSMARAVYSEADIYLLDDPLSAVDAHVGKHMFEKVIGGKKALLKNRTRILVTHSVSFLEHMDQIIVMKDGKIAERGNYKELMESKGAFSEFLIHYKNETEPKAEEVTTPRSKLLSGRPVYRRSVSEQPAVINKNLDVPSNITYQRQLSDSHYGSPLSVSPGFHRLSLAEDSQPPEDSGRPRALLSRENSETAPLIPSIREQEEPNEAGTGDGHLIEEETALEGRVKIAVYFNYIRSVGIPTSLFCFALYFIGIGSHTFSNYWLSLWADKNDANLTTAYANTASYLSVYAGLGLLEGVTDFTREFMLFTATALAARSIHNRFLESVLHSPMSFFDTNPTGRILNRFSGDIDIVDQTIPFQLSDFIYCMCETLYILVVICYSTPLFLTIIAPLFIFYFFVQKYYIATSRQLKRLESISKSPIFSHFSESVTGAVSIRAFDHSERFFAQSESLVQNNVKCFYWSFSSNRWLACRIESLGNIIVFFSAFFAIIAGEKITPGLAALSITYSLLIVDTLNWMIRMVCDLENNAVSLERIKEYTDNSHEADWVVKEEDDKAGEDWPDQGSIQFHKYETRYREGLDLVLKGVDLNIKSRAKIGICGRTGAGKSSLTLALFRIIEAAMGKITIDGVDISKIGLHKLRSRLTIIPQDPVLFTGDLRFNLDPDNEYSDRELWIALEHAHLKQYVRTLPKGLQFEICEGGENFSVGQRQLICLARALLRKTNILVLDEATAAVDLETDDLIQATIRQEFANCTVLTIAHRLNTIMDSCQIAVLKDGKLAELGQPEALMADKTTALYSMATEAGINSVS